MLFYIMQFLYIKIKCAYICSACCIFVAYTLLPMHFLLYQYLIIHKQLNLPGIGLLQITDVPARYNAAEKKIYAPYPAIRCKTERMEIDNVLYNWIATQLSISTEAAQNRFHTFINDMLSELAKHSQVAWKGLGLFTKDDTGIIRFTWEKMIQHYLPNITATKIIRNGASHSLLVGESKATNIEMAQRLNQNTVSAQKKRWWFWAAATSVIIVVSIVIYYLVQYDADFETIVALAKCVFLTLN